MTDQTKQPGIRIAQIFLERAVFEHRADMLEFPPTTAVEADVDLGLNAGLTADGKKARIQLTVASKDEKDPLYRFSFLMTALVEAEEGQENFPLTDYVRMHAWGMLLPFVRELVANITSRGRFGPLWIKPINLVALAQQAMTSPPEATSASNATPD